MDRARTVADHEADLLALESITSTPAGLIEGFVIVLKTTTDESRLITNACCVYHGSQLVIQLGQHHLGSSVPCPGDPS